MRTDSDELRARVRRTLQQLSVLEEDDVMTAMDSLSIVVVCTELENLLRVELSAVEMEREAFVSFDSLMAALVKRGAR
jgi:acyl carrier protein